MAIANQAQHEVQYSLDVRILMKAQLLCNLEIIVLGQQLARNVNAGLVYDRRDGTCRLLTCKRNGYAPSIGVVPAFP